METFNIFKEAKSKIGAKIENTKQYFAEKKANKDNAEESGEFAVNTMSPLNSRWDRYLGMTAAMTQVPVPSATKTENC